MRGRVRKGLRFMDEGEEGWMDQHDQKLIAYYNKFPEEKRLNSRHGQVEYRLTRHFINQAISDMGAEGQSLRVLDIGAGTGRYAGPLAAEGHVVTAVELVRYNVGRMHQKWPKLDVRQGDARDLFGAGLCQADEGSFDLILMLGPMYHLIQDQDKAQALAEAARLLAARGRILVAYLMNEYSVLTYGFQQRHILEMLPKEQAGKRIQGCGNKEQEGIGQVANRVGFFDRDHRSAGSLNPSFAVQPALSDLYDYVRLEDIAAFDQEANRIISQRWKREGKDRKKGSPATAKDHLAGRDNAPGSSEPPQLVRERIFSPDGPANYMRRELSALSEEEFEYFVDYQLRVCERPELLGAGGHLVEVLRLSEKSVE